MTGRPRLVDDGGSVGGAEVLPLAVLTFVVGTLLVAQAWSVIDLRFTLDAAARDAGRVAAETGDPGAAAAAARRVVAGAGRDPAALVVTGPTYRDRSGRPAPFGRCATAEIDLAYDAPTVGVPVLGRLGGGITVRASHAEAVDPHRSDLAGASC